VEAIEEKFSWAVKVLEKSMWRSHPSCIHSWSVLITFKSSESSKGVHPGSTEAFAKLLFVVIVNMKRCTLSFLVLLPITINSLDCWTSSSSVSRPYDAVTPPHHLFPQPCSRRRDLTGWPCRASCHLHQIPGWLKDRCSPATAIKWEALYQDPGTRLMFVRARHPHRSCSFPVRFLPPCH
jgi:hypothetical protein